MEGVRLRGGDPERVPTVWMQGKLLNSNSNHILFFLYIPFITSNSYYLLCALYSTKLYAFILLFFCYASVWYGMVWYGMVWCSVFWFGLVYTVYFFKCPCKILI